jgi:hypothetical protein
MILNKNKGQSADRKGAITKLLKFNDEKYMNASGKNWKEWFSELKKMVAEKMPHKQIAVKLEKQYGISVWWAQSIAVRFEQEIGRRIPGETCEGTHQANLSKTVSGSAGKIFSRWIDDFSYKPSLNGKRIKKEATTSSTKKWYYWREKLEDGSAISISFSQKEKDKTIIQVNHDQLLDEEEKFAWKNFWKKTLERRFKS